MRAMFVHVVFPVYPTPSSESTSTEIGRASGDGKVIKVYFPNILYEGFYFRDRS